MLMMGRMAVVNPMHCCRSKFRALRMKICPRKIFHRSCLVSFWSVFFMA